MDRIVAPGSVASGSRPTPPVGGTAQYATDGNPSISVPATVWPSYQYNAIQEELIAILAAAGITPDRTNEAQVVLAIRELIQAEAGNYVVDTGSAANIYVGVYAPPIAALTDGLVLRFRAAHANTAASTFAVNAIAAKSIFRSDGSALAANDIPVGAIIVVLYDLANTRFLLQATTVSVPTAQIQAQAGNYAVDSGALNAYVGVYSPVVGAHAAGMPLRLKIANTNTGASTFNPGPGAKTIVGRDGSAMAGGELIAGNIVTLVYDGTNYQLDTGVQQATNAEVLAGTNTTKFLTPAAFQNYWNTNTQFKKSFASAQYSVNSSSAVGNVAHNLGGVPYIMWAQLVCIAGDLGYSAGDRVQVADSSTNSRGVTIWANSTNIGAVVGSSGIWIANKTGGADGQANIGAGNWQLQFFGWR